MLTLGIKKADKFVTEQQQLGNDVRWDGYTMVFFRPASNGIYSQEGAFRNGVWGFDNRVEVNTSGLWEIDWRNVKKHDRKHNRTTRT